MRELVLLINERNELNLNRRRALANQDKTYTGYTDYLLAAEACTSFTKRFGKVIQILAKESEVQLRRDSNNHQRFRKNSLNPYMTRKDIADLADEYQAVDLLLGR